MKITIQYLVPKKTAGGVRYYWEPSPLLRKAGWKGLSLGRDIEAAQTAAKKRNDEVETWRNGGAKPREVKKIIKRQTFAALIEEYRTAPAFGRLAESTQREYRSCLGALDRWAGEQPVEWITRQRVQVLKNALLTPATPDGPPRYARARNMLVVLYNVLQVAVDADRIAANAAAKAKIPSVPPRQRVITHDAIAAIEASAAALGLSEVAFAVELGFAIMQREADVLHLTEHNWKELEYDVDVAPEDWPKLAGADGRVFGFQLRQRKTKVPIKVPVVGPLRTKIEAVLAAHREIQPPRLGIPLVLDPDGDRRYADWKLQRRFREIVNGAIATATAAGDVDLVADLTDIEFRDLRRSGMVWLFEMGISDHYIAAISGHTLEHTKKILETYGPRNTRMASGAIAASVSRLEVRRATREAREQGGQG